MNANPVALAHPTSIDRCANVGLQPAGAFLTHSHHPQQLHRDHHAHSPPMPIPPARHGHHAHNHNGERSRSSSTSTALPTQDLAASTSFLTAIRRGLRDNSPSWDNNGWFIGDDSDEEDEDEDDEDFYSSMYPYADSNSFSCYAPAGSFAGLARDETTAASMYGGELNVLGHHSTRQQPASGDDSLMFAMEV